MVERVMLYGGPKHGEEVSLILDSASSIEIEAIFDVNGQRLARKGKYTRVHEISGSPSQTFEWVGYATYFTPLTEPLGDHLE